MKYKFITTVLIIFSFNLSLNSQPIKKYLLEIKSAQEALNKIAELNIDIFHQFNESVIARASANEVINLKESNFQFKILDENISDEKYFLITEKYGRKLDQSKISGKIVYSDGHAVIIKSDDLHMERLKEERYSFIELQKVKVSQKTFISSTTNSSAADSIISNLISKVNKDSVRSYVQSLQDFQTRFCLASNRDQVAEWIKNKFLSFGITDVVIDSFPFSRNWGGIVYNTYQKNVIATIRGSINPNSIYIVGGHQDSYSSGNPLLIAPGADDNASGTAASLEFARVLKSSGYNPEGTIKLMTFAAEELGLHGSNVYANKAKAANMNIKLMINHDMISNEPRATNRAVTLNYYSGAENVLAKARELTQRFTNLTPITGGANSSGSDSYSFWRVGYPSIFFFENVFSPFYHSPNDLLVNANMDYCAEVMRASMALLLHSQIAPSPVSGFQIVDMGNGSSILLKWNPNTENDIAGYKIFQGTTSGNYSKSYFTSAATFTIDGLVEGTTYFFGIAAVDQLGNESDIQEKTVIPRLLPLAPKNLTSDPKIGMIELRWNKNSDYDLAGYNLYRANSPGGVGVKLNSSILTDTLFVDNTPQKGTYYYYSVRAVDNTLLESSSSNEVRSRVVSLDQGICIFDATKDGDGSPGNPTDQEVDDFYLSLVPDYNVKVYDTKTLGTAKLSDLGAFSTVIWHTNISSDLNELNLSSEELKKYLDFGGKLLLTSYLPSKAIMLNSSYPRTFTPGQMIYDKLKIKSVDYAIFSRFIGASPLLSGYPNIFVDTIKTLASNGYHLTWIESIDAAPGSANIFSYETNYDSTTTSGKMKGKPVGIEYLGTDFKVVTLSFPLYFMKFNEAKTLVNYILTIKFNEITNIVDLPFSLPNEFALYQNYPNPFNPVTTIAFSLPVNKNVTLSLFNTLGQKVRTLFDGEANAGKTVIDFKADGLPSGVYYYQIKAGRFIATKKMLLIK